MKDLNEGLFFMTVRCDLVLGGHLGAKRFIGWRPTGKLTLFYRFGWELNCIMDEEYDVIVLGTGLKVCMGLVGVFAGYFTAQHCSKWSVFASCHQENFLLSNCGMWQTRTGLLGEMWKIRVWEAVIYMKYKGIKQFWWMHIWRPSVWCSVWLDRSRSGSSVKMLSVISWPIRSPIIRGWIPPSTKPICLLVYCPGMVQF